MKTGYIQILDLDFEYKLWKNRLYFYRSEVEILEGRIHVLSKEISGYEPNTEHIKLMKNQHEKALQLLNNIETLEQEMALYAKDYPIDEKHVHFLAHLKVRNEMEKITERQDFILCNVFPELCRKVSGS
ncbi:MAG: hypothetical protein JXA77_02290 [Bacteroidales bacterium]|nr:hypothetical protein [Bacteroidales bacterium]MBN2820553.1 hypothetical protein [Bacteroidales bacterium]